MRHDHTRLCHRCWGHGAVYYQGVHGEPESEECPTCGGKGRYRPDVVVTEFETDVSEAALARLWAVAAYVPVADAPACMDRFAMDAAARLVGGRR